MEKQFYNDDDFEQLLKEKSDQFRMYPSKRVWHSIYNDLHPGRKWPSIAMSMMLILALLLVGHLNTGDNILRLADGGDQNSSDPSVSGNTKNQNQGAPGYRSHSLNNAGAEGSSMWDIAGTAPSANSIAAQNTATTTKIDPVNNTVTTVSMYPGPVNIIVEPVSTIAGLTATGVDAKNNTIIDPRGNNTMAFINTFATNGTGIKNNPLDKRTPADKKLAAGKGIIQSVGSYIKSDKIFTDVAVANKKKKAKAGDLSASNKPARDITGEQELNDENAVVAKKAGKEKDANGMNAPVSGLANPLAQNQNNNSGNTDKLIAPDSKLSPENSDAIIAPKSNASTASNKSASTEEKAWIENYAFQNKPPRRNKWKGRSAIEFYVTPAINYRSLTTDTKGSATPYANSATNSAVTHKPGLGIETGLDLSYSFAKNLRIKAGVQFNYTTYGIVADETNHPILTSLLLNDVNTGYSYAATRPSTLSNSSSLQPVTVHNTSYQVSIPVGLAVKLATNKKLEWFAGASIQPTYVFRGKAYLLSSDLKNYISEPSAIRTWNLNTGFETYINYKLGALTLQAGPQFRYQWFSTYKKDYTSIEKPYAIGLKIGIVKGF